MTDSQARRLRAALWAIQDAAYELGLADKAIEETRDHHLSNQHAMALAAVTDLVVSLRRAVPR